MPKSNPRASAIQAALQGFSSVYFPTAIEQIKNQQELTMRQALEAEEQEGRVALAQQEALAGSVKQYQQQNFQARQNELGRESREGIARENRESQERIFGDKQSVDKTAAGLNLEDFAKALGGYREARTTITNPKSALKDKQNMTSYYMDKNAFMRGLQAKESDSRMSAIAIFKALGPDAQAKALEMTDEPELKKDLEGLIKSSKETKQTKQTKFGKYQSLADGLGGVETDEGE